MILQREHRWTIEVRDVHDDTARCGRAVHIGSAELHGVVARLFVGRRPFERAGFRIEEGAGRQAGHDAIGKRITIGIAANNRERQRRRFTRRLTRQIGKDRRLIDVLHRQEHGFGGNCIAVGHREINAILAGLKQIRRPIQHAGLRIEASA